MTRAGIHIRNILVVAVCLILLVGSALPPGDKIDRIRAYTSLIEFDYVNWTLNALVQKMVQAAVGAPRYMTASELHGLVTTDLQVIRAIDQANSTIEQIYSDPNVPNPARAAEKDNQTLERLRGIESQIQPPSETILQDQVSSILAENSLTLGGQPIPPLLYHSTPLPMALIISPRNVIEQEANISLVADLTLPQMVALEDEIEQNLNVSALVVPVGGVGVYPTMVMSTTDLNWLAETISHEWTHNYLTLRPLGINYDTTSELRTMNETTASIVGKEIGSEVIQKYYPELAPKPAPPPAPATKKKDPGHTLEPPDQPPPFDFRAEMHTTRVSVDKMLAEGRIKEAEDYMEARRRMFWDHGYQIRRLNQAYFAFYGAYADVPGGAAGSDPVGPAVRALRAQSTSLADFLNTISWMTSFQQLQQAIKK